MHMSGVIQPGYELLAGYSSSLVDIPFDILRLRRPERLYST